MMEFEESLEKYQAYEGELESILLSADEITRRAAALGQEISRDYADRLTEGGSLVLVGALKGVFMFMADLCRYITLPVEVYFMDVAAHEAVTRETGLVTVSDELGKAVHKQHVIFIEDIVDAGLTLNYSLRALLLRQPASLEVCTMFNKEERRVIDTQIKYVGFELSEIYIVGYGLDYKERYRNLPFVAVVKRDYLGN